MVAWTEVRGLIGDLYEPETRVKALSDSMTYLGAEKVLSAKAVEDIASLATVDGLKVKKGELTTIIGELSEVEKRPKLVADYATALGAEKLLSAERIEELALLSTVDGLKVKSGELKELAAPYIAKAYVSEGRKELVAEATDLASVKVIQPVREFASEKVEAVKVASKGYATEKVDSVKEYATEKVLKPTKELAEPYIAKSTEIAAPYIAKLESKRAEIVGSKRYEKAVSAIQQAREHPKETITELRSKAIDLLKYDNLASYRDYIQSEEFQADTMRLVKVELPAIASDAAARGMQQVKQAATSLAADIEEKREKIASSVEKGYTAARRVELADLQDKAKLLAAELQAEVKQGVEHAKSSGFSITDAIARIKKVVGAIDSILLAPLLATSDEIAVEAPTELAPADLPSSGSPEAEEEVEEDDEAFDDAEEKAEPEEEPEQDDDEPAKVETTKSN